MRLYRSGGSGFDFRALQEKKLVCLKRGPLSLVSTAEELLGSNSSSSGLESREYCRRDFLLFIYIYIYIYIWRRAREPILRVSGYSYYDFYK
jgi:hypothetical protein